MTFTATDRGTSTHLTRETTTANMSDSSVVPRLEIGVGSLNDRNPLSKRSGLSLRRPFSDTGPTDVLQKKN